MSWKDELFTIDSSHLDNNEVKRNNKYKKFEYGYNDTHNCVIISRDGTLGEIYEVQGLRIGLPSAPKQAWRNSDKSEDQVFTRTPRPASLNRYKTIFDFQEEQDEELKERYAEYIEEEWNRRTDGYWFMSNGEATYITGFNYFFLNYHSIDTESGYPDFRHSNRIFCYFLEACNADHRSYGMCYLKNRRSGFSHIAAAYSVHLASMTKRAHIGILSKTGADAKQLFTEKVVGCSNKLPFFFKPIQAGMDKPKTELVYAVPSVKLSRKSITKVTQADHDLEGLDTKVTWLNTGSNSYDGFKLRLLVHDESGKWEKPNDVVKNWTVTKTCLRLGRRIVGKVMMGSTSNALDKGGEEFKNLYYDSDLTKVRRNGVGQTPTGMYAFFINALWNMEGFFDEYGWPVIETPEVPIRGVDGGNVDIGARDFWQAEVDGLKHNQDLQHEYTRQFPLSEKHAFRDEATNSLFNLIKIYEQVDFNEEMAREGYITQGSFQWVGGKKDTKVEFYPNKNGRFLVSWLPPKELQNNIVERHGIKHPGNNGFGAFGCDPYDISGAVGGGGSKGSLAGITTWNMDQSIPNNRFFLEYIARPQTAEIFFEDVLMALAFYGMPALIENNKPRLLYHLKRRGYRGFAMNRPDKTWNNLSKTEKELGGIPNSSEDIKQAHAAAIESWIQDHVGRHDETEEMGQMYFSRTLEDWAKFDITNRTEHDASISSGLAFMACQHFKYRATHDRGVKKIDFGFNRYDNKSGNRSTLIK